MTEKILGVGTPSLGAPSPLKFFLDFYTWWNFVYFMHMFEACVCPLDVIGVEFEHRGDFDSNREMQAHDSDHAECGGVYSIDSVYSLFSSRAIMHIVSLWESSKTLVPLCGRT